MVLLRKLLTGALISAALSCAALLFIGCDENYDCQRCEYFFAWSSDGRLDDVSENCAEIPCSEARCSSCFEIEQILVSVLRDAAQFIELVVVALRDDAAVPNQHRRVVDDRPCEQFVLAAMIANLFVESLQQRRFKFVELPSQLGES